MAVIPISNLHKGINFKDNPTGLGDGVVVDSIGFDLTKEGSLVTNPVFSAHGLGSLMPTTGEAVWAEFIHANGGDYLLVATTAGLYVNGDLASGSITGQFKAVAVMNQIYIVSENLSLRYDLSDSTAYQLGITAPGAVPTFTAAANVYKEIDTFEGALTDWIANAVNCTCSAEATIVKVGSKSLEFAFAANVTGYSYDDLAVDCSLLSDASTSPEDDLVHFYLYVDRLDYLQELYIQFDLVGTAFNKDFYSYTILLPGNSIATAAMTPGKTTATVVEDVVSSTAGEPPILGYVDVPSGYSETGEPYYQRLPVTGAAPTNATVYKKPVTVSVASGVTDVLGDQTMYYWRRDDLIDLQSGSWCKVEIPKNYFTRFGADDTLDWSDVKAVRFKATTAGGAVTLYVDDLKIVGGGNLKGDYWFMYSWGRQDANGSLVNWSAVARASEQVLIAGPVTFNRQKVTYAARPLSGDAQVNCGLIYILGGNLQDWRLAYTVPNNTTVTASVNISEEDCTRLGVAFRNDPAPGGKDVVFKYGRLWICGMPSYPSGVCCSEITADGDVLLEAWSPVNTWLAEGEKALVSLSDMGNQNPLVVRGYNGEYQLAMADPADLSTVQPLNKISTYGTFTRTSKVPFEDGELYPSVGTFVLGTASGSKAVMPEFSTVIKEDNMRDAVGMTLGWVSYFSFLDHNGTERLIKVDRFNEALRVGTLTDKKCDCLFFHPSKKIPYAVYDGVVYRLEDSYNGDEYNLNIISKGYVAESGSEACWQRIEFQHNTNGYWVRCYILVDGKQIGYWPFKSTRKQRASYTFGPVSGNYIQFSFKGQYRAQVEIDLPIRIHYG